MPTQGRPKKPIEVQEAKRRVHRSNAEKEARRQAESRLECPITEFDPPPYLTKSEKRRFGEVVGLLQSVNEQLCTALDADQVARYVVSETQYKTLSRRCRAALNKRGDGFDLSEANALQVMQNRAFAQMQTCATALGLNVSSRLKFDIPEPEEKPENKFAQFAANGDG